MPFYLNFVDDKLLNNIPQLQKFTTGKVPRFRILSRAIPKEEEVRERYTFTLPNDINSMENHNSSMHILEKPWPLIKNIEEMITKCKDKGEKNKEGYKEIR
jgi:hypothetical protein